MDVKLEISDSYLNDVLKSAAIKQVGEVMSLFETISDINELKLAVKNSIYQNYRDLNGQVRAFDSGVRFVRSCPVKN